MKPYCYLIVNADDMGLHEKINEGIILGHQQGCISSTTLMAGGPAFEQAVALLKQTPSLGVGVHLTLVADRPVSAPEEVSSLVDSAGHFWPDYGVFLKRYVQGKIRLSEVELELTRQIERVRSQELAVTHVDSHQHLHIVPGIAPLVAKLCRKYQIKAVRYPRESFTFTGGFPASTGRMIGRTGLSVLAMAAAPIYRRSGLVMPDHFFGMLAGGNLSAAYLEGIIKHLPQGVSEIMTHPGADDEVLAARFDWHYHWEEELKAAWQGRDFLQDSPVKLIHYGDLIRLRGGCL